MKLLLRRDGSCKLLLSLYRHDRHCMNIKLTYNFPIVSHQLFRELQNKIEEYESIILQQAHKYQTEIDTITSEHRQELDALRPLEIKKRWVRNKNKKGGYMQWMPHVDKCIIEMLANRTQPSCVQANILVVCKILHPTREVVKSLLSLRYIQAASTAYWQS